LPARAGRAARTHRLRRAEPGLSYLFITLNIGIVEDSADHASGEGPIG
jgi:hypothetical protein